MKRKVKLLDELIGDSQTDPRPIIVTQEDNTESKGRIVAMLLPPGLLEDLAENEPDLDEFQLLRLTQELDMVEGYWGDSNAQQTFVVRFLRLTSKLWKAAPEQKCSFSL